MTERVSSLVDYWFIFNILMYVVPPNNRWVVQQFQQLPLQDYRRKRTDVFCAVASSLLVITLFVWALLSFNREHIYKANFPADGQGNLCGVDRPSEPWLYFADIHDATRRYCVSHCPKLGEIVNSPSGPVATTFSTEPEHNRMGRFCFPASLASKDQLFYHSQLFQRDGFFNSWDSFRFCAFLAIPLGIFYLVLVQLFPLMMNWVGVIGGGVGALLLGLLLLFYRSVYFEGMTTGRMVVGILMILVGLYLLISSCIKQKQLRLNGIFLVHTTRMVRLNWLIIFYIPFFLLLVFALIVLTLFELFSFWSLKTPTFNPRSLFWQSEGGPLSIFLSFLLAFQFYWGLCFIKEAFNFIISGAAVSFYFRQIADCFHPFNRLIKFHWGSVAAGSFMTGLFAIPDAIFDFFKPENILSGYAKCYTRSCFWLYGFFDLVRSDAIAFIHLTGLPYCNSARYCEYLSTQSPVFGGHQSISRLYRFGSHALITSIVVIIGLYYTGEVSFWSVVLSFVFTSFIVTFFSSLHADAADAICITFLAEEYLEPGGFQNVQVAPPGLTFDIALELSRP